MYKLTVALLIFMAGWGLGWYMHDHSVFEPLQSALPVNPVPSKIVNSEEEVVVASTPSTSLVLPDNVTSLVSLLQRNEFESVLERYESLQVQADEVAVATARTQILSHASLLIADHHFNLAEKLLQLFLSVTHRDVEARILLAIAYRGQTDFHAAIDQLYEARGYAYRAIMLQRITKRIRSVVAELTQSLKSKNDQSTLLALYQHLTQLEPNHAPYFMELAAIQLALDDKEAARISLQLVLQDPNVGAQAQAMLSKLSVTLTKSEPQVSTAEVVGIPLLRSGNNFIVEARPDAGLSIQLLIDTGASMTILTSNVLKQLGKGYQDTGRTGVFNTANGRVRAPIYKLDSLTVGEWQVNDLEIGVLNLGGASKIDGLLGMNFLNKFQFFIDQNESVLRLSVN